VVEEAERVVVRSGPVPAGGVHHDSQPPNPGRTERTQDRRGRLRGGTAAGDVVDQQDVEPAQLAQPCPAPDQREPLGRMGSVGLGAGDLDPPDGTDAEPVREHHRRNHPPAQHADHHVGHALGTDLPGRHREDPVELDPAQIEREPVRGHRAPASTCSLVERFHPHTEAGPSSADVPASTAATVVPSGITQTGRRSCS
jgi:hypothetical protein